MARGVNVTTYLPADLKAQANEAGIPIAFALQTILRHVLAARAGAPRVVDSAQVVLDEMERTSST